MIVSAVVIAGIGTVITVVGLDSPLGYLVTTIGISMIFATGIYFALGVRHILGVRLYRHQALGLSLILATLWATSLLLSASRIVNNASFFFLGGASFLVVLLAVTYWLDSSIRSAILSDPLVRDSLHWRQVRKALLPLVLSAISLIVLFVVLSPSTIQTNPFDFLYPIAIFGTLLTGAIFVPLYAHRSGDRVLRLQLKWFGLFLVSFLGTVVAANETAGDISMAVVFIAGFVAMGFSLYRSARSLVPIFKFEDDAA